MPLTEGGAICFTLPLVTTWLHGVVALKGLKSALYDLLVRLPHPRLLVMVLRDNLKVKSLSGLRVGPRATSGIFGPSKDCPQCERARFARKRPALFRPILLV
jgi:hypothetical protein